MAFSDTFDQILARILADHLGQDPATDVSKGSPVFIKSAALASALYGLNKDGSYVDAQRFADTAAEETLDHYIAVRGLPVIAGERKPSKKARVVDDIRHPPAGGNRYDYPRWCKEASPLVAAAYTVSMGQGAGTIDLVILADASATGSEIPADELCATVRAYIVDICPDNVKYLRVLAPEVITQDVTIPRINSDYPTALANADITSYMSGMVPGGTLYRDQLKTLALGGSGGSAPVTAPVADVPATPYQMIRPGVINVT